MPPSRRTSFTPLCRALICATSFACSGGNDDTLGSTNGSGGASPNETSETSDAVSDEVEPLPGSAGAETDSASEPEAPAASATCSASLVDPSLPPPSVECQAFAELACTRLLECKPRYPSHNDGISDLNWESCLSFQVAVCEPLNLPGSTLTNASLAECTARLESASCALLRGFYAAGMRVCAATGTLEEGETCERFHQCSSASCRDGTCGGSPLPRLLHEWAYDVGETPAEGASCNNSYLKLVEGRCEVAGSQEGGACPCNKLEGLECMCGEAPCACAGESVCPNSSEGTCAPPPELLEGATCRVTGESFSVSGWCEAGTVCFSDGNTSCVAAAAEGEPCSANARSSTCAAGLVCAPQGEVTWTGTCVPPVVCLAQ